MSILTGWSTVAPRSTSSATLASTGRDDLLHRRGTVGHEDVEVEPGLAGLLLRHRLEPDPRSFACRIDEPVDVVVRVPAEILLGHDGLVVGQPGVEAVGRRLGHIAQQRGPEPRHPRRVVRVDRELPGHHGEPRPAHRQRPTPPASPQGDEEPQRAVNVLSAFDDRDPRQHRTASRGRDSLPSTSCITRHASFSSSAGSRRRRRAPSVSSRSASASSAETRSSPVSPTPTRTSRCSRFFTVLASGTRWKNNCGPTPSDLGKPRSSLGSQREARHQTHPTNQTPAGSEGRRTRARPSRTPQPLVDSRSRKSPAPASRLPSTQSRTEHPPVHGHEGSVGG